MKDWADSYKDRIRKKKCRGMGVGLCQDCERFYEETLIVNFDPIIVDGECDYYMPSKTNKGNE